MNLKSFDLNLLRVFHAVYSAGNVRRAAAQIGLSQPAVSNSLTRLRLQLKDPLFVRAPGGVAPTAKAAQLARFVEAALKTIEIALAETERFEPQRSERRFVMHMSDLGEGEFLPELMQRLQAEAPGLRLVSVQLAAADVLPAMEQSRIDLAVGYLPALEGTERLPLLSDRYVVLLRQGHPLADRLGRRAQLHKADFILVDSHAEPARALHQLGLESRIRLTVPHFQVLPEILARTDLAAIVPWRPAQRFARTLPLQIVEPALGLPPLRVSLHWYWRMHNDPGHRWLRETIVALFGEPPPRRARA